VCRVRTAHVRRDRRWLRRGSPRGSRQRQRFARRHPRTGDHDHRSCDPRRRFDACRRCRRDHHACWHLWSRRTSAGQCGYGRGWALSREWRAARSADGDGDCRESQVRIGSEGDRDSRPGSTGTDDPNDRDRDDSRQGHCRRQANRRREARGRSNVTALLLTG